MAMLALCFLSLGYVQPTDSPNPVHKQYFDGHRRINQGSLFHLYVWYNLFYMFVFVLFLMIQIMKHMLIIHNLHISSCHKCLHKTMAHIYVTLSSPLAGMTALPGLLAILQANKAHNTPHVGNIVQTAALGQMHIRKLHYNCLRAAKLQQIKIRELQGSDLQLQFHHNCLLCHHQEWHWKALENNQACPQEMH